MFGRSSVVEVDDVVEASSRSVGVVVDGDIEIGGMVWSASSRPPLHPAATAINALTPTITGSRDNRARWARPRSISVTVGESEPPPTAGPSTEQDPGSSGARLLAMARPLDDAAAMTLALAEADAAVDHGDVPIGAVIVRDGVVIAARHNERELTGDPTAHAEVLVLRDAAAAVGHWRLEDCTLYVTLEPCFMCAGAVVNARLGRLVFGASDPKAGAVGSLADVPADARLNHRPPVTAGVLATECGDRLRAFFAARRR